MWHTPCLNFALDDEGHVTILPFPTFEFSHVYANGPGPRALLSKDYLARVNQHPHGYLLLFLTKWPCI
jgi:hypothetical protein